MISWNIFLSGAITMQYLVAAHFFLQYRKKTGDSFFAYFAAAFALLALERCVWLYAGMESELQPAVYLFRLFAFALIIMAVLVKNRETKKD